MMPSAAGPTVTIRVRDVPACISERHGRDRIPGHIGEQIEDLRVRGSLGVPGEPGRHAASLFDAVAQGLQVPRVHPQAGDADCR